MWFVWTTWQMYNHWAWEFDEKNEPFPRLVTEIPSVENGGITEDGKVITMKLRDDITWSDGTPVTADDFVFTYEMAVSPNNTVATAYPYDYVASMEAPDPQTVVINLASAYRHSPIAAFQAAHAPDKPLSGLPDSDRDQALVEIGEKLAKAIGLPTG